MMSVKDMRVYVRCHMNTGKAHFIVGDTKIVHLSLKEIGRIRFKMARHYDKFKPYYSHVSFDGRYAMEC